MARLDRANIAADLRAGLGLLTRLPVTGDARGPDAAWAWPLAGAVVAALAGGLATAALWLGLAPGFAAALALAAQAVLTGAMHEDGLADSADGLWGGWTRERRLEIMKDSHIGSYGVLALILSVLARWSALAALFTAGAVLAPLIAVAALSRVPMVALLAHLPNARGAGLAQSVGQPAPGVVWQAGGLALLLALIACGWAALAMALLAAMAAAGLAWIARAKIGGQTGDILGASQQLAEVAVLAVAAALLA